VPVQVVVEPNIVSCVTGQSAMTKFESMRTNPVAHDNARSYTVSDHKFWQLIPVVECHKQSFVEVATNGRIEPILFSNSVV